ncbi:MAG: 3' terminal RNA ribose 2'-O-methyltransferase Hen1 [Treponema sp.]|nr:3' terminal RNA ribose 2'-O-methyltransferase Hen1 [Treponema sp.]
MLLTISYSGTNTTDLGYLLHKNPARPQSFELSYGAAHVFYPCISDEKTTAALLLDIDPIDLARGKNTSREGGLFDYVNDRPYVSSSFLSSAIANVFRTAMTGRCEQRQALADAPLELEAAVAMLPCKGDLSMLNRVFQPLGYETAYESFTSDELFPAWGESNYVNLTIKAKLRLRDLLKHLYVLIPVFDRQKHYWVGEDEVEKLLRHSEDWLPNHPEKGYITGRYLKHLRPLVNKAFSRLVSADEDSDADTDADSRAEAEQSGQAQSDNAEEQAPEKKLNLNAQRLGSVNAALKSCGARSVIDMGCGGGRLLGMLVREKQFERLAGVDVSHTALEYAAEKLKLDRLSDSAVKRITLFQGSLTYKDSRFKGYDAACVIEVIEHLDIPRLAAFERVLFEWTKPPVIILTTPNREYNVNYEQASKAFFGGSELRHSDHRFEWTRAEFRQWATRVAEENGYDVRCSEIGDVDEALGAPTQMGVFTLCG